MEQRTEPQPREVSQAPMALNLHLEVVSDNLYESGRKNAGFRKEELKWAAKKPVKAHTVWMSAVAEASQSNFSLTQAGCPHATTQQRIL